jgi:hypothetical protein
MIARNANEIELETELSIAGTVKEGPYSKASLPSYFAGKVANVSEDEFSILYGTALPDGSWHGEIGINDAFCQFYYAKSGLCRLIYKGMKGMLDKAIAKGEPNLDILFVYNMPIRGISRMTGGKVNMEMVYGITEIANGHFLNGLGKMFSGVTKVSKWVREGGLFFLFSNLVTIIQYIIYAFLPNLLGMELAGKEWSWPAIPVTLFGVDFTWNAIGYDVVYDTAGNVLQEYPLESEYVTPHYLFAMEEAIVYADGYMGLNILPLDGGEPQTAFDDVGMTCVYVDGNQLYTTNRSDMLTRIDLLTGEKTELLENPVIFM